MRLFLLSIGCIVLTACAQSVSDHIANNEQSSSANQEESAKTTAQIASIQAGTERDEQGGIVNPRTAFSSSDRTILFNVQLTGVTEDTTAEVYWFIEDDTGPFAKFPITLTPEADLAKLDLPSDIDWPGGIYTMLVQLEKAPQKTAKTFQYRIEER